MKSFLKKAAEMLVIVPALVIGLGFVAVPTAHAATDPATGCDAVATGGIAHGAECAKPTDAPADLFGPKSIFVTITNIMLFIIGAIAVIMLIIGGIRYVVSAGDQTAVTSAKNTILYAIIGIIVAFLAYAAVNFISTQLTAGTSSAYKTSTSRVA